MKSNFGYRKNRKYARKGNSSHFSILEKNMTSQKYGQIVPTPCGSISHHTKPCQKPYNPQNRFFSQRPYLVISIFFQYTTVGNPLYTTVGNPDLSENFPCNAPFPYKPCHTSTTPVPRLLGHQTTSRQTLRHPWCTYGFI